MTSTGLTFEEGCLAILPTDSPTSTLKNTIQYLHTTALIAEFYQTIKSSRHLAPIRHIPFLTKMVYDLIRDGTLGQFINWASSGKYLPYADQLPGYRVPGSGADETCVPSAAPSLKGDIEKDQGEKNHDAFNTPTTTFEVPENTFVVDWDGPNDPDNPKCVSTFSPWGRTCANGALQKLEFQETSIRFAGDRFIDLFGLHRICHIRPGDPIPHGAFQRLASRCNLGSLIIRGCLWSRPHGAVASPRTSINWEEPRLYCHSLPLCNFPNPHCTREEYGNRPRIPFPCWLCCLACPRHRRRVSC